MDEIEDPRPVAELLRQWSTDHPEFQFLPRKFKIAITGSPNDRAVTRAHDIGLRMLERDGQIGFEVIVVNDGVIIADGPTGEIMADQALLDSCHLAPPQIVRLGLALAEEGMVPAMTPEAFMVETVRRLKARAVTVTGGER